MEKSLFTIFDQMYGAALVRAALVNRNISNEKLVELLSVNGLIQIGSHKNLIESYRQEMGDETFKTLASSPSFMDLLKDFSTEIRKRNFQTLVTRFTEVLSEDLAAKKLSKQDIEDYLTISIDAAVLRLDY